MILRPRGRLPREAQKSARKTSKTSTTSTTTTTTTTTTATVRKRTTSQFIASLVILAAIIVRPTGGHLSADELKSQQDCSLCRRPARPANVSSAVVGADEPRAPPGWSPYELDQQRAADICRQRLAAGQVDELCYSWRYRYIDEQNGQGHEVRILDGSIDERVANSIYTAISVRVVDMDFFKVHSGHAQLDRQNLASVASRRANDEACGRHLSAMLGLLGQLEARLERKRANASFDLALGQEHIRLARVLDSFGRYESGLMLGKTHAMGSHDQCVTSRLELAADGRREQAESVKTRYCWARMDLGRHLSAQLRQRKSPAFEAQDKVFMLGTCLPESCHTQSFLAEAGPRAQENRALAQRLIDSQFKMPKSLFIEETRELKTIYCLVDADSEYSVPLAGKLALAFLASWILLAIYATYYQELRVPPSNKKTDDDDELQRAASGSNFVDQTKWAQALLDCLNLKKSWQDFIEEPYDEQRRRASAKGAPTAAPAASRRVELDVLNPIKTFGAGFVVLGHSVIIQAASSMNSLRAYNIIENDPVVLSMIVGTVVVDTFFVITGVLMAYVAMRKSVKRSGDKHNELPLDGGAPNGQTNSETTPQHERDASENSDKRGPAAAARQSQVLLLAVLVKQWARFAIQRHLRLLPLFFLVYWFKRSVLIYLAGFGQPLWDNGFNKDTLYGACKQESWLVPFTMMTSFLPLSKQCLPQAWSISTDLFFSLVVTPIVLIMTKRPRVAALLALLMGLISYGWTLQAYNSVPLHMAIELSHLRSHGFAFMFGHLHNLYTFPHFRLGSVLVGLLVGYSLHLYHERAPASTWPHWIRGWATKASFATIVSLFITVASIPQTKAFMAPYERQIFTHLFTSGRLLWALANGVLFIRMSTDWKDSFLMRQFATSYWSKLVKLNLAILLVHMDILMFQMGNSITLSYFTRQNIFVLYSSTYLLCIPVALLLHIIIENPIDKLLKRHVVPRILV